MNSRKSSKFFSFWLPVLCAASGNVIWGFSFVFLDHAMEEAGGEQYLVLSVRFFFAMVIMLVVGLVKGERISFKGKKIWPIALIMLFEVLYFAFETLTYVYTDAVFTGAALAIAPVFAILMAALFLRERPTVQQKLFCILPVAGVIILSLAGKEIGTVTGLGLLFLLGTCLLNASSKTVLRFAAREYSPYERTFSLLLASFAAFTAVALLKSKGDFGIYKIVLNPRFTLNTLALAAFCSVLAHLLVNYAAGRMSVTRITAFSAITTIVSTITGVCILHDRISFLTVVGIVLILVGIFFVTRPQKGVDPEKENITHK